MLSAALLLTTGCNGSRELDEVAYVITVGVDAGEGDQLEFTYRIAVPRNLASGESGGGKVDGNKTTQLVTITAPTLAEGRNLLNATVARAPNLSHVNGFVIGEDLARRGLADFLGPAMRFREFRGSIYLVVVNGKAKDFLKQNSPEEVIASRWMEAIMDTADETGYYLRTTLHEFYARLKNGSGSPYAVLMGINPLKGEGSASGPNIPGDKTREYLPKDLPREGGNPATVMGTAVFKADKMVGMLPNAETRMLAMLLGNYPRGLVVVDDPLAPQHAINVNLKLGRNPKINVDILDGQAVINVNVHLEGEISGIPSGINYESKEYKGLLEQQISQTVRQRMLQMLQRTQAWGADVVNFGYYLRPKYATDQKFRNLNWDAVYRKAEFNVIVTTELHRTGLMRRTMPIRLEKE
jgi:spore germination protein KC